MLNGRDLMRLRQEPDAFGRQFFEQHESDVRRLARYYARHAYWRRSEFDAEDVEQDVRERIVRAVKDYRFICRKCGGRYASEEGFARHARKTRASPDPLVPIARYVLYQIGYAMGQRLSRHRREYPRGHDAMDVCGSTGGAARRMEERVDADLMLRCVARHLSGIDARLLARARMCGTPEEAVGVIVDEMKDATRALHEAGRAIRRGNA